MNSKIKDLTGMRFGRLLVIEYIGTTTHRNALWLCQCDCGNTHNVRSDALTSNSIKSCGCLTKESTKQRFTKHGLYKHPLYDIWCHARDRTQNKESLSYKHYGGRGIEMCREWTDSFEAFLKDMEDTWKNWLTLDRIDVNGDYSKENCRWADGSVQSHNRRKKSGCVSKYIGVWFNRKTNKFRALICKNGQREFLGYFNKEEMAAKAYDDRSEELYGDRPNGTV